MENKIGNDYEKIYSLLLASALVFTSCSDFWIQSRKGN